MMLEDFLLSLGHEVRGTCENVREALQAVAGGGFRRRHPRRQPEGRERLAGRQPNCAAATFPFVLASGGHVDPPPAEFKNVPMIDKPYTIDRVTPAIEAALAG